MGYDLETAENDMNIRLSNAFPLSRSSRAEDGYYSHAIEMETLPNFVTDSRYTEGNASLDSDSEKSEEAITCKGTEPAGDCLPYTKAEEASVIRVFDRRLVLFIALLYMLSFLDRSSMLSLRP